MTSLNCSLGESALWLVRHCGIRAKVELVVMVTVDRDTGELWWVGSKGLRDLDKWKK